MEFEIPRLGFVEHRLDNGLRVVVHRNSRIPLTHLSLYYGVGSSLESPGLSGLAHLFEHMMFQGSENVSKNEHGLRIDSVGGAWNAATGKDRTHYYETVPSNCLELALWLEADRMRSLAVTEENFENQRKTVIEEKKQSYDNRPYGNAHLRFDEIAYPDWAYGHPIIGSVEDLQRVNIDDALDFHRRFYGPGNAVLVLAGDLDIDSALQAVEKHFGDIPNRTDPSIPDGTGTATLEARTEAVVDALANLPALSVGYPMGALDTPDYYALSQLGLILAEGDSSRFYRKFIYELNWLTGLFVGPRAHVRCGVFRIWLQLRQGIEVSNAIQAIEEELARVAALPVTAEELEKARNQVRFRAISRIERISQVGEMFAQATSLLGGPEMAVLQVEKQLLPDPAEIREVAARTFLPHRRVVLISEPSNHGRKG